MLFLLRLRQNLLMQPLLEPPVWRPNFPLATVCIIIRCSSELIPIIFSDPHVVFAETKSLTAPILASSNFGGPSRKTCVMLEPFFESACLSCVDSKSQCL